MNILFNKFVCVLEISGEFVMVHAAYQSHLGQDYFFAPRAKLADGVIWLMIIKAGITRANLLQVNSSIKNNISGLSNSNSLPAEMFLKAERLLSPYLLIK